MVNESIEMTDLESLWGIKDKYHILQDILEELILSDRSDLGKKAQAVGDSY